TDIGLGGKPDLLTLSLHGANVRIQDPNAYLQPLAGALRIDGHTLEVPLSSISGRIQVIGLNGNDSLTLDFGGGNFLPPGGINYDGGGGTNTLTLVGVSPFTNEVN